jgi:hypothetical protein
MKTLAKEHGILSVNQATPSTGVWTITVNNGWRAITGSTRAFISETYFDLGGMSQREKTMFIDAATVQEVAPPVLTAAAPGDGFLMADIMTSEPLTDVQALNLATQGNFGSVSCGLGFQETIYARIELWAKDLDTATWPYPMRLSSNQLGSLMATASDRIYSYRVVNIDGASAASDIAFSGVRHLINAVAKEEPEYQYLMRLRRSYELQQSYDED